MKKLFAIWVAFWIAFTLTLGNVVAEESPFKNKHVMEPVVYAECQLGKWFIVAYNANAVSVMQVFEDRNDMVPKPMECSPKQDEEED